MTTGSSGSVWAAVACSPGWASACGSGHFCCGTPEPPRAALLELEHWGARRRCRRQSQETPREYLERLAGGPLRDALDAPMQARYSILVDDVERSLYSTLPPRLSREQVRELLSTVHRSARTPPARAK